MRLKAVASAFNKAPCLDAYTGDLVFYGQFNLYDDTKRDSEAAERRVLSLAPDTTLPDRLVIEAAGTKWIIGHGNPDVFRGEVIRVGHVVHEAPTLATIRTLEELCVDAAGVQAYAGVAWVKNQAFTEQSSTLAPQLNIHFSLYETVEERGVVEMDGDFYSVRTVHPGPSGTLICYSERMDSPVESASVYGGAWDPVTESFAGPSAPVRMIRMRWQSLFQYRNAAGPTFGPGDIQLAVSKTLLTPVPGMEVTLSDGDYTIESVADEGVWLCRARANG